MYRHSMAQNYNKIKCSYDKKYKKRNELNAQIDGLLDRFDCSIESTERNIWFALCFLFCFCVKYKRTTVISYTAISITLLMFHENERISGFAREICNYFIKQNQVVGFVCSHYYRTCEMLRQRIRAILRTSYATTHHHISSSNCSRTAELPASIENRFRCVALRLLLETLTSLLQL